MKSWKTILAITTLSAAVLACGMAVPSTGAKVDLTASPSPNGKPHVVITSPDDGIKVMEGTTEYIAPFSTDPTGLQHVDLIVDGKIEDSEKVPDAGHSITLSQKWEPSAVGPGKHTVSVVAYNVNNVASDPASITIQFTRDFTSMSEFTQLGGLPGAYTKAQPCGVDLGGCTTEDHSLVPVIVENGTDAQGVDISDWYAPVESIPFLPIFNSRSTPVPTPDASSSSPTISGSVLYPDSVIPGMMIVAFSVSGFPNVYSMIMKQPGERTYKIQVPAGQYYMAAYAFPQALFTEAIPAAPTNLSGQKSCTPSSGSANHISIQLNWMDPASDEDYYIVDYGKDSVQLPANTTSFKIDQELPAGASLNVKVIAHNAYGDASSNTQTFTCP